MENIQTTTAQKRQKTGGRQKGTPNRINASVKVRIKDFLLRNEETMLNAFQQAKPNEKLNFWYKMTNLVCAKQTNGKDDGEWRPGPGIDAEWLTPYEKERRVDEMECREYMNDLKRNLQCSKEVNKAKYKLYEETFKMVQILVENDTIKKIKEQEGDKMFWQKLRNIVIGAAMEKTLKSGADEDTIYYESEQLGYKPEEDTTKNNDEEPTITTNDEEEASVNNDEEEAISGEFIDSTDESPAQSNEFIAPSNEFIVPASQTDSLAPSSEPIPDIEAISAIEAIEKQSAASTPSEESPASPQPSPSTCCNCVIESNLGMPRLPNRMAKSNFKV